MYRGIRPACSGNGRERDGFEPRSSHSKCDILPLDEGRFGAGSEDRTHTSWLEAKHAPQYAMPALIWRRVESTILTGEPADRLAGDAGHQIGRASCRERV